MKHALPRARGREVAGNAGDPSIAFDIALDEVAKVEGAEMQRHFREEIRKLCTHRGETR